MNFVDIKENMFKYQGAIIKYCQNMQRKTPFVKDMLRRLRDAIAEEPEKIQSNELFIIGHNYPLFFMFLF